MSRVAGSCKGGTEIVDPESWCSAVLHCLGGGRGGGGGSGSLGGIALGGGRPESSDTLPSLTHFLIVVLGV